MTHPRSWSPAGRGWLVLASVVLAFDASAPPGQTLSDHVARLHACRPWTTRLLTAVLVGHLLDWTPDRFDPFHLTGGQQRVDDVAADVTAGTCDTHGQ